MDGVFTIKFEISVSFLWFIVLLFAESHFILFIFYISNFFKLIFVFITNFILFILVFLFKSLLHGMSLTFREYNGFRFVSDDLSNWVISSHKEGVGHVFFNTGEKSMSCKHIFEFGFNYVSISRDTVFFNS